MDTYNFNRLEKTIIFSSVLLMLNGCTLFQPYVDAPTSLAPTGDRMPKLRTAIQNTENIRTNEVVFRRNEITGWQGGLKLASFGALTATGIGALYSASSSLLLGLGTGGVTTYLFGNLFFSDAQSQSYQAANNGLSCVVNSGYALIGAEKSLSVPANQLNKDFLAATTKYSSIVDQFRDINKCSDTQITNLQTIATNWTKLQTSVEQTNNKVEILRGRDTEAAQKIDAATASIISALNTNIEKNNPTYADIVNATKNISTMVKGIPGSPSTTGTSSTTSTPAEEYALSEPAICSTDTSEITKSISNFNLQISSLNDAIDKATNEFSSLGNSCSANPSVIAPIKANPAANVVISPSSQYAIITISGGKPPFKTSWKTSPAPSNLSANFASSSSGDLIIIGSSPLPAANAYTLTVTDDQAAPQSVDINITVQAK